MWCSVIEVVQGDGVVQGRVMGVVQGKVMRWCKVMDMV